MPAKPTISRSHCIMLHALLVLFHITLLLLRHFRVDTNYEYDLGGNEETDSANTRLSLFVTAAITFYAAILVGCTQVLSLKRELTVQQSLTATHDKTIAWSGLASAIHNLWQQISIPTSIRISLCIATYLALILLLNNTTPLIFGLEVFNATIERQTSSLVHWPITNYTSEQSFALQNALLFLDTSYVLDLLNQTSKPFTTGLYKNMLYDVLDETGIGNLTVNATLFNVDCGTLPDKTMYNISKPLRDDWSWNISIPMAGLFYTGAVFSNYGSIATASWSFSDYVRDSLQDRYTMVYASVNITDSEGINTFAPINSIVPVFATFCNLNLQKLTVLTKMNHPLEDQIPPQKTLSKWKPWSSSALPIDNRMNISWPYDVIHTSPLSRHEAFVAGTNDWPVIFSFFEWYLMRNLNLASPAGEIYNRTTPIMLHDLENVLASQTAALFWAAFRTTPPDYLTKQNLTYLQTKGLGVQHYMLKGHLKFRLVPILLGLVSSAMMLLLAAYFTWPIDSKPSALGTIGILQVIWLLKGRPEVHREMERVFEPSDYNLRRAAMNIPSSGIPKVPRARRNSVA